MVASVSRLAVARAKSVAGVIVLIGLLATLPACSRSGSILGIDPDQRSLDFGNKTGGEAGGTVTVYSNQNIGPTRPFFRTGVLGDFSNERSASFQNIGTVTKGTGTAKLSRSWTVPLEAGLAFPTGVPNLTAQIYGGAEVTRNKESFSLTEGGAPAGPGTSASETWTSVDPAVGGALLYQIAQVGGRPVNLGPSVTVSWMGSHSVSARSPNFATQAYVLNSGNRTDTRAMLNLTVGLNSMMDVGVAGGATW